MENRNYSQQEYESAKKSVQEIHNFYLIVFVYVVMMFYLHWLDLRDGSYDWAYWVAIGFTASLIWFAVEMLPFRWKEKLIQKELKKQLKK
ncbi:2TM domain-containing protein [Moheibacter lacus]|uniref:2TM domain-containing protein n=1 Tax=Moheibacter lacus TaxID=2745851 RepID=A0A838ZT99_9FLAO|nr:2TM domain-containing protein [Moheibacter lacus]MBA5630192.1 2TM domain-containing protein [Moheibacter lacus]